jgi:hypothetical protein
MCSAIMQEWERKYQQFVRCVQQKLIPSMPTIGTLSKDIVSFNLNKINPVRLL